MELGSTRLFGILPERPCRTCDEAATVLEPLLEAIFDYFEKHGGEEVVPFDGPAPRGPLIRDMQAKMEKLHLQDLD